MKKFLKGLGIFILALIAFVLIAGLFVNKDYRVEREVTISKPKTQVFDYVKMLKNQNSYSKWAMMDPNAKKDYRGTDGTVGFVSSWDGNRKVGKGEQEITKIDEGERVDWEIRFEKPMKSVSPAWMTTEAVNDAQTRVRWGFSGRMPYPFNTMRLFMSMDKMIGDDLQTGLNNLKTLLERQ